MIDVDVYWRPGCGFCSSLRQQLDKLGVAARWHNIWEDDAALEFVRTANRGNETVPTVQVGDHVLTNPSARQVAELAAG